jgi:hypothetical protein
MVTALLAPSCCSFARSFLLGAAAAKLALVLAAAFSFFAWLAAGESRPPPLPVLRGRARACNEGDRARKDGGIDDAKLWVKRS